MTSAKIRLLSSDAIYMCYFLLFLVTCLRRKRGRFDRVMDDRDDFTNGQPVKMKKLSRKRKSIQKKLMGSIESLNALEDLAASRASKFLYRPSIDPFG